jgi:murein endopeptidase
VSGNDILLSAITLQLTNLSRSVAQFQAWSDEVTASTLAGQMYLQNLTLWIQDEVSQCVCCHFTVKDEWLRTVLVQHAPQPQSCVHLHVRLACLQAPQECTV